MGELFVVLSIVAFCLAQIFAAYTLFVAALAAFITSIGFLAFGLRRLRG